MKYLYMIFRLFFCPHKFSINHPGFVKTRRRDGSEVGHIYIKECRLCNKIEQFEVSV